VVSFFYIKLESPCIGTEAAARFKALRTMHGKELKKIRDGTPRSGDGTENEVPNVTKGIYAEMNFFKNVIKPRA